MNVKQKKCKYSQQKLYSFNLLAGVLWTMPMHMLPTFCGTWVVKKARRNTEKRTESGQGKFID
jgi:cytochrome c-type biogenesis protein CcmH/NrfF